MLSEHVEQQSVSGIMGRVTKGRMGGKHPSAYKPRKPCVRGGHFGSSWWISIKTPVLPPTLVLIRAPAVPGRVSSADTPKQVRQLVKHRWKLYEYIDIGGE